MNKTALFQVTKTTTLEPGETYQFTPVVKEPPAKHEMFNPDDPFNEVRYFERREGKSGWYLKRLPGAKLSRRLYGYLLELKAGVNPNFRDRQRLTKLESLDAQYGHE
jgi:hypothetical protein